MRRAAKNLIPPTMGYNDDVKDYTYDPRRRSSCWKEAGSWKKASPSICGRCRCQRPGNNLNARRMAEMIQADWAKIGVRAKIVTTSGASIQRAGKRASTRAYDGLTGDNGDPITFVTLFSCAAAKDLPNYSRWCYKAV